MSAPAVWCPSCGAEYTVGSSYCSDCRVELVAETRPPESRGDPRDDDGADVDVDVDVNSDDDGAEGTDLVELGDYSRLEAQILRRRLETAGISVMVDWSGPGADATGTILVPDNKWEWAEAVIREIEVDDEVPDTSPEAYIIRIEEHLSAIGQLLGELRTRLDDQSD